MRSFLLASVECTYTINPLYNGETPKWIILQTVKTTYCGISPESTLFVKVKQVSQTENTIFSENYNPYTLRCVYWTIPRLLYQTRRKNPLVYKGLRTNTIMET